MFEIFAVDKKYFAHRLCKQLAREDIGPLTRHLMIVWPMR